MATVLDGRQTAKELREKLASRIKAWVESGHCTPCLAAVLVGDDPASRVYVRNKQQACEAAGINSQLRRLPHDISQEALLRNINELNQDPQVHGILVQLPLPAPLDAQVVLDSIHPHKDVDCFHPENVGLMVQERPRFLPCTPHGVLQILKAYDLKTAGHHVVIVGRSEIVGKPMAALLQQKEGPLGAEYANATVTICHSRSRDLEAQLKTADFVVAAIGRAEMIQGSQLKPGAIVIDVGINRTEAGLTGDVNYASCAAVAAAITPVPGGIGPLTVAMLLENTFRAAVLQAEAG